VGFDQAGDTRQNLVQGCTDEHHLQRIQYRLGGEKLREGRRCWESPIGESGRTFDVYHKQR
jgi:hypothetical protein